MSKRGCFSFFLISAFGVMCAFFAEQASAQSNRDASSLAYGDCALFVEILVGRRFQREDGPIAEYLHAVRSELDRVRRGTRKAERMAAGACPRGFRRGDSNGAVACFAVGSAFDRYPNVNFHPITAPVLTVGSEGEVEACVKVSWLIYSFGEQERTICSGDEIAVPSPRDFIADAVAETCGPAPAEESVCR